MYPFPFTADGTDIAYSQKHKIHFIPFKFSLTNILFTLLPIFTKLIHFTHFLSNHMWMWFAKVDSELR
jgi:hypothetical protein